MPAAPLILAIDQGTSATKCVLVDVAGAIVGRGVAALGEAHPMPGWVEQDALEIWHSVRLAVRRCLDGQDAGRVVGVGVSTQRESMLAWDRRTGTPLGPMLSWQDQRGAAFCDTLREAGHEALVRRRSGLPLDPMFSAAKAHWLLDAYDPDRRHARNGDLCLGTVDAWLLSRFSHSSPDGETLIEAGNASRTQLLRVADLAWDDDLLALFDVPLAALPHITASSGPFPPVRGLDPLPDGVPLLAVMGDSHAALYGHGARCAGQVKATYGTGSSVMGLIERPEQLDPGLCLTIAWQEDTPRFAAEGNIRASGSALRWLAQLLGRTPEALAELGASASNGGVALVPGFTGLGAPYWDRDAVGLVVNLRLDTGAPQLARAALDAMVQQVADVVAAFEASTGPVVRLFTDGGPSRSDALMQRQADLLGCEIARARDVELSALGVAHMAGLGAGIWSAVTLADLPRPHDVFSPAMTAAARTDERAHWRRAVARSRST